MDKEYSKYFDIFYKEKSIFLSGKKKHKKCEGCSKDKIFTEKDNELIYSCGSKSGNCGQQFKIILPEYIDYLKEKENLLKLIHGSFNYHEDIENLTEYNLSKLSQYLPVEKELKIQEKLISESEEKIKELDKTYIKNNNLNDKFKKIEEYQNIKHKDNLKKKKIMNEYRKETTTSEQKRELLKEYAKLTHETNKEVFNIIDELKRPNINEIKIKQEEIIINNEEKEDKKEDKKADKKEDKKDDKKEKVNDKGYEMCKKLAENKFTQKEINEKRLKVHDEIMKEVKTEITKDNFKDLLKDKEIKLLFELYDKHFFNNELSKLSKDLECQWVICWNNRCTKSAGRQRCRKDGKCKTIDMELSTKVFANAISKMIKEGKKSLNTDSKNKCDSILTCLQFTFEHELVHGLQNCFCEDWMYKNGPGIWTGIKGPRSGHSKTFMSILNNTFGHVDYRHSLFSEGNDMEESKKKGDQIEDLQLEIVKDISKKEKIKKEDKIINNYNGKRIKEKYIVKYIGREDTYVLYYNNKNYVIDDKNLTKLKTDEGKQVQEMDDGRVKLVDSLSPDSHRKEEIKYFSRSKDNKWLSAFNKGEPFKYDGYEYPTVEHAFHAQKIDPKDPKIDEYKNKLSNKDLPANEAKKLGGKKSFKENDYKFRKDWDEIKLKLMEEITEEYYKSNPKLLQKLKETGESKLLHSGPLIDNFWGINKKGGENHHGKILMKIRKELEFEPVSPRDPPPWWKKEHESKKLTKKGEEWVDAASEDMKKRIKIDSIDESKNKKKKKSKKKK